MSRSITYEEVEKRLEDRRELAEAYLIAMIEASSKKSSNDNNLEGLEKVAMLLNKAYLTFKEAINSNSSKRRELLEEAFRAYTDIVPYLQSTTPYLTNTVLRQIKNVERMIELEIENSVKVDATNIDVDSMMKEAREAFL